MCPSIKYSVGDIVSLSCCEEFDVVTAIDVLSHLNTEEQIISAIAGIHRALKPEGFFIWYDIYANDHFESAESAESQGYHPRQMSNYSTRCGFTEMLSIPVFKKIGKQHTVYLCRRLPMWFVSWIERLPGDPGNIAMLFRKTSFGPAARQEGGLLQPTSPICPQPKQPSGRNLSR